MTIVYTPIEAAKKNLPVFDYANLSAVVVGKNKDQVRRVGNALDGTRDDNVVKIEGLYVYHVYLSGGEEDDVCVKLI